MKNVTVKAKRDTNDFPFHRQKCVYGEQKENCFLCFRMVSLTM